MPGRKFRLVIDVAGKHGRENQDRMLLAMSQKHLFLLTTQRDCMKPKLFIGCSTDGTDVAFAVQQNLDDDADITVWNQGFFELSGNALNELERAVKTFDFAIFIFKPEDKLFSKEEEHFVTRDNVIFETGLFIGRLGSNKVYMLKPKGNMLKIPSDLLGITIGEYSSSQSNLVSATAPFCTKVRSMIKKYSSETLPLFSNKLVKEDAVRYEIKILNEIGDMILTKTISLTALRHALSHWSHEVFCDTSSMQVTEMDLLAWDNDKNELHIEMVRDTPNKKRFKIHFRESIDQNDSITYSFSYLWKNFFPSKEEYFKIRKTSTNTSFCIHFPADWTIRYLKAESDNDNEDEHPIALQKKNTRSEGSFRIEEYAFKEAELNSAIIISWNRK